MATQELSLYDLGRNIQDEGGWEEFHQRRHNYTMYDHHKSRRLKLQAEYNRRNDARLKAQRDQLLSRSRIQD